MIPVIRLEKLLGSTEIKKKFKDYELSRRDTVSVLILSNELSVLPNKWEGRVGFYDEEKNSPELSDPTIPVSRYVIQNDNVVRMLRFSWVLRRLSSYRGNPLVLDIGSSDGGLLETLYRNYCTHIKYIGIELSRSRAIKSGNINPSFPFVVLVKDVTTCIPLNDKSVDVCVMLEILEHFDEGSGIRLLDEAIRVTKNEGEILLSTPNGIFSGGHKWHAFEWPRDQLLKLFEEKKLEVKEDICLCICPNQDKIMKHFPGKFDFTINKYKEFARIYPKIIAATMFPDCPDIALSNGYVLRLKKGETND